MTGPAAARGRRPGGPDTRGEILEAARASFAERGFRGTTIRAVAGAAGVDPALVHHYFGTKDDLFLASLEMPVDPRERVGEVFGPGLAGAGARLLEAVLGVWDVEEARRPLVAMLRNGLDDRADLLREGFLRLVDRGVRQGLAAAGGGTDAAVTLRAQLVESQVLGLLVARYVLELEPLASLPAADVVRAVGPTVQRYLDGPLP